jgi:hypothetical protein
MPPWLLASPRGYRIGWLARDLVAGVMLAAVAIPGQLAARCSLSDVTYLESPDMVPARARRRG